MDGPFRLIGAVLALAVLSHASISDVRTRRVSDAHWAVLLCLGIPLSGMPSAVPPETSALYLLGSVPMALYILSGRVQGAVAALVLAVSAALFTAPLVLGLPGGDVCAASLACCLLFALLHTAGLIAGGADAKCLMSLALAIPGALPVPPAMAILITALALTLCWIPVVAWRNIRSGHVGRGMLSSYSIRVDDADPVRHWPVERLEGGVPVRCRASYKDSRRILEELREAGAEEVRVTPSVPFILPITIATALVLLV
ncbi:MAG: hypothetical protein Q4Q62_06415 [Thermoplasmata archaeon]|nr:hypothetical protein [Thermoplasmata archaeon]